jgi:hypothetical protein
MFVHGGDYLQIEAVKAREPIDRARAGALENTRFRPSAPMSIERFDRFRAVAAINTDTDT